MEATVSYLLILRTYIRSKQKTQKKKEYALYLGNILNDITNNNMKKTGLKGVVKRFSVDFNPIDHNDILNIHKYLKKT